MISRAVRLVLGLLLLGPLVAQDDLEARQDAVQEFTRFFKKAKEEALQVESIMTLEGNECPEAAVALWKLLTHKVPAVQQAALQILATYKEQQTFQRWIDALPEEKDAQKAAITIKVLGQSKIKGAVPAIETRASGEKTKSKVRFEAARALMQIGEAGEQGLLGTFVVDKAPQVRMAAADAIGKLKVKNCSEAVTKLLEDPHWQVQTAAIEAVAMLRPQPAVQPLIDLMRRSGRLRMECADALFRITALDFGVDPERWQQQWDHLKKIKGWRIPTDEELAKKAASRKKYDAFYGKKEETNKFAGIPTTSTSVLFVIDQSGSMDNLVVEVEKFQGYKDRKRFTIVQTELINTIDSLSKDTNFNIVAFATKLKPWKKRLVPANVVNRDAAKSFVSRLKPIGGTEQQEAAASSGFGGNLAMGKTNTIKALLYGFGVDPDKKQKKASVVGYDKKAIERPIDTIYFLSDGRPSVGKVTDPEEILAEVRKVNDLFRIVIHTIAIGNFDKSFLEILAQQNGGVYVDLGQ